MGVKLRERKGKGWYVFTHWKGQRKAKFFGKNKALAKDFREKMEARLKLGSIGIQCGSGKKFENYARTWLNRISHTCKRSTCEGYKKILERYLFPAFKGLELEDVTREKVRSLAFESLDRGLSYRTVVGINRCLSSLLSHAVEDGLLQTNLALRPGKFLPRVNKKEKVKPLTREEVSLLLGKVKEKSPAHFPFFLCAVRTGLRLGELIALQWGDIDFHSRFILIQRNYTWGEVTTPKSGETRRVDMSNELTHVFRDLHIERQIQTAANGWVNVPDWVFCSEVGGILDPDNFRKRVFYPILKASELRRFRLHDLRHTFASLLLQQGESLVYVKEQMGHSSIQVTVDIYGDLIPGGNKQAVDRLDDKPKISPKIDENATQTQPG